MCTHWYAGPVERRVPVTDVISSDRFPALESAPVASLPELLPRLARRGLIHGVNPADILAAFRGDPILSARVAALEAVPPWRWKLHARHYLVWALRCRVLP